jgi:hypothetical protein
VPWLNCWPLSAEARVWLQASPLSVYGCSSATLPGFSPCASVSSVSAAVSRDSLLRAVWTATSLRTCDYWTVLYPLCGWQHSAAPLSAAQWHRTALSATCKVSVCSLYTTRRYVRAVESWREWSASRLGRFIPWRRPTYPLSRDRVGPTGGLHVLEKSLAAAGMK